MKYSIKELESLSGIKAHTIRIWEKRYGIIQPERTKTNIRKYCDRDLKRLLNISILYNNGFKISQIASLSHDQLCQEVTNLSQANDQVKIFIDQLTIAMIDMAESRFEKLLSNYVLRFGFEKTITHIIYPFLEKVGILWLSDDITPIHEHFMSNLIRQKIIVAIDGLNIPDSAREKVVLFLPENEIHEIGLLFYHYIVRSLNYNTFYLGQYVPLDDLKIVTNRLNAKYLVTTLPHKPIDASSEEFLTHLSTLFPKCTILVSLRKNQLNNGKLPQNVIYFENLKDLKRIL